MNQITIQKKLGSSISYFFLGFYLTAEPFLLKLFFEIYFPDFCYRVLTLPISIVVGIAGFKNLQDATGNNDISKSILAVQTEIAKWRNSQFRKRILSRYKLKREDILCVFKGLSSEESAARKHSTTVIICLCLTTICIYLLIFHLPDLFKINLLYWGLYEASVTISGYGIMLVIFIISSYPLVVNEIIQIKNALESEADLKKIVKMLREELKSWRIEYRVVLPDKSNLSQQKKYNLSFISRLFKHTKDIDIVATSPENYCCVIELKSHVGKVKWDSKFKQLCRQLGRNPEYIPFKKDPIDQVKTQADKLKKHRNLTQMPDKILLFSQATIKLDRARSKRLKSQVVISYPLQLINDLKERNQEQIKRNARNANSRRPRIKD